MTTMIVKGSERLMLHVVCVSLETRDAKTEGEEDTDSHSAITTVKSLYLEEKG
jgi:hypothetical protein